MRTQLMTRLSLCVLLVLACMGVAGAQSLESIVVHPATVIGGEKALLTVKLDKAAPKGGEEVTLSSNSPAAVVVAKVKVVDGKSTAEVVVDTTAVSKDTEVILAGKLGKVAKMTTLTVKAPELEAFVVTPSHVKGGKELHGDVKLTGIAPTGGLAVGIESDSKDVEVPAHVVIFAKNDTRNFTIMTTTVAKSTVVTLKATLNGITKIVKIIVVP